MRTIIPLNNKILVLRAEQKDRTDGGIIIPDAVKERPAEGTVVAVHEPQYVGDEQRFVDPPVQVGDKVMFARYAGVEMEDKRHVLLGDDDLLCKIVEGP